jgi:hypothetical protein
VYGTSNFCTERQNSVVFNTRNKCADDGAKAMADVLRALADGDITPSEASSVSGVIKIYCRTLETAEFEGRLQSLERVTNHEKT